MHVRTASGKLASILTIANTLALSALAITTYAADKRDRDKTKDFFETYTHTLRRPLVAETVDYAPRADWLGGIVADAVLGDVYGTVDLNALEPEQREAWLAILPELDAELKAARAILLDSFRARPGWPLHPASLGQIEYTLQRRPGQTLDPPRWRTPLTFATTAAPGAQSASIFHAAGEMELAALGSVEIGAPQKKTIERAFADPTFLQNALPTAVALLGIDEAIAIVPDEPRPLRRTFDFLARQNDVPRAAGTWRRWESAERRAREEELKEIERVAELGDRPRVVRLIRTWARDHSPREFGDAGAAQLVRLLAVWPADDPGTWRRDPRGEIVRLLLERDPAAGSDAGKAIWAAARPLDGMPEPYRAQAMLAGGRLEDAERLASSSQTAGSFEWTRFWVAASRERMRRNDVDGARSALSNLAPSARAECDPLLISRAISEGPSRLSSRALTSRSALLRAGSARDPGGRAVREPATGQERGAVALPISRSGSIPLCLEESHDSVAVEVSSATPVLLAINWNSARESTLLARPGTTLKIPVGNRTGREILTITPLAGAKPDLSATLR